MSPVEPVGKLPQLKWGARLSRSYQSASRRLVPGATRGQRRQLCGDPDSHPAPPGTKDVSPISDTTAKDRRVPLDAIHGVPQGLLTFRDGDHTVFSGATSPRRDPAQDALCHDLICQSTTAFWDAWLRQETKARAWLRTGAFARAVGGAGVVEIKNLKWGEANGGNYEPNHAHHESGHSCFDRQG